MVSSLSKVGLFISRGISTDRFSSVLQFLIEQYHADPNTFSYDESYDVKHDVQLMSRVFIDLGNYLASKYTNGSFILPNLTVSPIFSRILQFYRHRTKDGQSK